MCELHREHRYLRLGPRLLGWVEELISPQPWHKLGRLRLEFGGVDLGELIQGERPTVPVFTVQLTHF